MFKRCFVALFTVTIVLTLVPQTVAQSSERTMPMRTPDGQPDISGIFTFRTLTPLQRPRQFEGRETLTAEEAAEFEASERRRQNRTCSTRKRARPATRRGPRAAYCHTTSSGMSEASS